MGMGMGPVLPPRSAMCGPQSHHYSAPLNFRKGLASKCTWKCTAIIVIMLCLILVTTLFVVLGNNHHHRNLKLHITASSWHRSHV